MRLEGGKWREVWMRLEEASERSMDEIRGRQVGRSVDEISWRQVG
ncbi:hypothetical protein [Paenibacillus plantarum]|nr:hypothetical protein [Paenibacillus plantarum]